MSVPIRNPPGFKRVYIYDYILSYTSRRIRYPAPNELSLQDVPSILTYTAFGRLSPGAVSYSRRHPLLELEPCRRLTSAEYSGTHLIRRKGQNDKLIVSNQSADSRDSSPTSPQVTP